MAKTPKMKIMTTRITIMPEDSLNFEDGGATHVEIDVEDGEQFIFIRQPDGDGIKINLAQWMALREAVNTIITDRVKS